MLDATIRAPAEKTLPSSNGSAFHARAEDSRFRVFENNRGSALATKAGCLAKVWQVRFVASLYTAQESPLFSSKGFTDSRRLSINTMKATSPGVSFLPPLN